MFFRFPFYKLLNFLSPSIKMSDDTESLFFGPGESDKFVFNNDFILHVESKTEITEELAYSINPDDPPSILEFCAKQKHDSFLKDAFYRLVKSANTPLSLTTKVLQIGIRLIDTLITYPLFCSTTSPGNNNDDEVFLMFFIVLRRFYELISDYGSNNQVHLTPEHSSKLFMHVLSSIPSTCSIETLLDVISKITKLQLSFFTMYESFFLNENALGERPNFHYIMDFLMFVFVPSTNCLNDSLADAIFLFSLLNANKYFEDLDDDISSDVLEISSSKKRKRSAEEYSHFESEPPTKRSPQHSPDSPDIWCRPISPELVNTPLPSFYFK